jgi:hypothetical protein
VVVYAQGGIGPNSPHNVSLEGGLTGGVGSHGYGARTASDTGAAVGERLGTFVVGGVFSAISLALIFGCRAGARMLAFRDRSSPMYRWYTLLGSSDERSFGLAIGLAAVGLFTAFIGFGMLYSALIMGPR